MGMFNSTNHSLRMKINHEASKSKVLSEMNERMKAYLSYEKAMYFNHRYGFSNDTFQANDNLRNFFDVLSYNHDKNGKLFISMVEGKKMPVYAV